MDLDSDGNIDILSGSYSRRGSTSMAGVFQVLQGTKDGTFLAAKTLAGSDGEDLVLPAGNSEDADVDRICTRPFAADLDGDGKLDIVSGNFAGNFAFFRGEGAGKFAPVATWLQAGEEHMSVSAHGDPFLIDWDGDGDIDLLSGSDQGGAFLFTNEGSKTAPRFTARKTVVEPVRQRSPSDELGDAHLTRPGKCTRVWSDDVNGDGKLDLLLGDDVTLYHAAKGVEESVAVAKMREYRTALEELMRKAPSYSRDFSDRHDELEKARDAFVTEESTGFVWVLYRK